MYENYKYGNFDKLESAIDDALNQARKHRKKDFWNNNESKPSATKQEPGTANMPSSLITIVNKKSVSTKTKSRRWLESGGITARA
ncbi:hypothetical protein [Xenorhabdus stockiae]|uniref:hypothetical protein n=1 Tax=Xenorhabdus stockiae TaxID=351614 RepID=UPI0040630103